VLEHKPRKAEDSSVKQRTCAAEVSE